MSQTIWQYNGIEVEYDAFDADTSEKMEDALDKMRKADNTLPKDGKASTLIRAQCKVLRDFFDYIFGDGKGKEICGEKDSLTNCKAAYLAFLDFVQTQKTEGMEEANEIRFRYSGNRAQRRAAENAPKAKKR